MINKSLTLAVMASMALTSCSSLTNEDAGVLTGGVVGGLLGSQFGGGSGQVLAAGAGALVGAYLGGKIGKTMDVQDKMRMERALETSKTGQSVRWRNPDSGHQYVVKPTKTYYQQHQPCRQFTTTVYMNGKKEVVHGKACRDKRGHWRMK